MGAWTVQLVEYTSSSVEWSINSTYTVRSICAGVVPATFFGDGTGLEYIVEFGEGADLCRTLRISEVQGSPPDTLSDGILGQPLSGFWLASRNGTQLTLTQELYGGGRTLSGTFSPEGHPVVSDGTISGRTDNPGPILHTWSEQGSWTMAR